LSYLMSRRDLAGRLARAVLTLSNFSFRIQLISTSQNYFADFLSRHAQNRPLVPARYAEPEDDSGDSMQVNAITRSATRAAAAAATTASVAPATHSNTTASQAIKADVVPSAQSDIDHDEEVSNDQVAPEPVIIASAPYDHANHDQYVESSAVPAPATSNP